MTNHEQRYTTTRRGALGIATVGLGAAIGRREHRHPRRRLPARTNDAGSNIPPSPTRAGGSFTSETGFAPTAAPYVDDPAQPLVSSGLAYVHYTGGSDHNWLAPHAMFVVFSNRCTHVGCPAQATAIGFSCPCHGSQLTSPGARIAGPAHPPPRPLPMAPPEKDNQLWITPTLERPAQWRPRTLLPGQSTPASRSPGKSPLPMPSTRPSPTPTGPCPSHGSPQSLISRRSQAEDPQIPEFPVPRNR